MDTDFADEAGEQIPVDLENNSSVIRFKAAISKFSRLLRS